MAKFPQRLFQLLKQVDENGWEDIFSWVNNGTGFKVHDREKFEMVVLQKHFNTTRYSSFARQLHIYGFDCVRTGRQTGIYSHPRFQRDDPKGSASLKREIGRNISKKAIVKRAQVSQDKRLGGRVVHAGDTIVRVPAVFEPSSSSGESDDDSQPSSPLTSFYNNARSRLADRAKNALIRIPATTIQEDHPFNNNKASGLWSLGNTSWSQSGYGNISRAVSDTSMTNPSRRPMAVAGNKSNAVFATTSNNANALFANNSNWIRNDDLDPLAMDDLDLLPMDNLDSLPMDVLDPVPLPTPVVEDGDMFKGEDWEPIPFSPLTEPSDDEDDEEEEFDSLLEPRPIGEMVENPASSLNTWLYDSVPMLDTPRKRVAVELSLPLSLPIGFLMFGVPTYGICVAATFILGHLVQCAYTAWGGSDDKNDKTYTKDLTVVPGIGMLQHHIMDLLWSNAILSNMLLTPHLFGPWSYFLSYCYIWPQPVNLCIVIKTHYRENKLEGTFPLEKYWIGDLVKFIIVGYAMTLIGVFLMSFCGMEYLRIPLVFGFNMIPLFVFESYRYLLSVPAVLDGDKSFSSATCETVSEEEDRELDAIDADPSLIDDVRDILVDASTRCQQLLKETEDAEAKLVAATVLIFSFILGGLKSMVDVLGLLYPAYMTLQCVVPAAAAAAHQDSVQWMSYWLVYSTMLIVEGLFPTLFMHIPYYLSAKIGVTIWMCHPKTMGAKQIFKQFLRPVMIGKENIKTA